MTNLLNKYSSKFALLPWRVPSYLTARNSQQVAAAGNFLSDACSYSPSRASGVLSVASSNRLNAMSWFSNYGNCTNIFAPVWSLFESNYLSTETVLRFYTTLCYSNLTHCFLFRQFFSHMYVCINIYIYMSGGADSKCLQG